MNCHLCKTYFFLDTSLATTTPYSIKFLLFVFSNINMYYVNTLDFGFSNIFFFCCNYCKNNMYKNLAKYPQLQHTFYVCKMLWHSNKFLLFSYLILESGCFTSDRTDQPDWTFKSQRQFEDYILLHRIARDSHASVPSNCCIFFRKLMGLASQFWQRKAPLSLRLPGLRNAAVM